MAIAIRGTTPGTTSGTGDPTSLTLNAARQPQANDVLIIIHSNDFYDLTNIPTPTVGGSTTGVQAIVNADDGASQAHAKSFYYVAGSTGDLTVAVDETGSADEEKMLVVYVLSGVDTANPIVASAAGTNGSVMSHVCPAVTAANNDDYLICHLATGPFNSGAWTAPGTMAEQYDITVGGSAGGGTGAVQQLSASGSTGTRTFTSANLCRSAAISIAVKTSGAPPPAFDGRIVRPIQSGRLWR